MEISLNTEFFDTHTEFIGNKIFWFVIAHFANFECKFSKRETLLILKVLVNINQSPFDSIAPLEFESAHLDGTEAAAPGAGVPHEHNGGCSCPLFSTPALTNVGAPQHIKYTLGQWTPRGMSAYLSTC
jgi:hypothetical protein